ncbi:uncharacterized protein LOC142168997 [Nicotiana tabacum]|uniref:Uncharacterized protein LOC142168997 n=1 Tax=Nicotiana tabacum TaxID=4097 RepID=A0AC58SMT7_TOBAC
MENLTVLLRHSGKWNSESNYVDYSIEGILIKEYTPYNNLVALISKQLDIDLCSKSIKIEYKVDRNCTPMEIHNYMGYRVYVELKKVNREFGVYPLCITTIDKEVVAGGSLIQGDLLQIDEANQRCNFDTDDTLAMESINSGEPIEVMEHYAISERFQFRADRSNAISYTLLCMSEDCEWRFKASSINKSQMFKVREFNNKHTCPLKDKVYEQCQASSSLIGGMIRSKLTNHKRKYTPKDIINDVKSDFGVDVSYMLAWWAKEKAMNFLRGEPADSYNKLPGYLYTMDMTYPGSHIRMVKSPQNVFMYVYISLYAFIKGFDHCRPIVVVDGSHLKSAYTGTFVSASTLDGAGHILPLAYGVIDSENDAAWSWFFEQFKEAYGERENMCIISDRNESIIKSVLRVYPMVPHFACIWHLWNNVYKKFKKSHSKLSEIYFSMAKAYTHAEYDSLMEKVEKVVPSTEYLHTVNDEGRHYTVCLLERKCSCGRFQVDELPCPHAWAVLKSKFLMPEDYCSDYYKPKSVIMTYEVPVYPLPDQNEWNIPAHISEEVVLLPKWKRPPGRPKKKHDKPFSELLQKKNQHLCSICGQGGHNKRTCRNAPRRT